MSGTIDPDYANRRQIDRAPRRRRELVLWLKRAPPNVQIYEDDWREVCLHDFPLAASGPYALALENSWPVGRWREALQAWSGEDLIRRSWRFMSPVLQRMPDELLLEIAQSATWWLETASKVIEQKLDIFLDLCCRFLKMQLESGSFGGASLIGAAINHPVGHITHGLLQLWFRRQPKDNDGLPEDLGQIFTALCDTKASDYRAARLLMAANAVALFRVDQAWVSAYLLPLFEWGQPNDEALAVWAGFLWSARLFRPLISALRCAFLITSGHYEELREVGPQYASMLTYVSLERADTFTVPELAEATAALPRKGLEVAPENWTGS